MKKTLRNKESKALITEIKDKWGYELNKKSKFEMIDNLVLIDNETLFFYFENKLVPCLKLLLKNNFLKKVTIDMGAVPYAVKGADMMRPGITNIDDDINEGEIVSIIDENNHKSIMVGIALFNSNEMNVQKKGKSVKNIHFIGDEIWNY